MTRSVPEASGGPFGGPVGGARGRKRVREFGTLKALDWTQAKVVRQIAGESLPTGSSGGSPASCSD